MFHALRRRIVSIIPHGVICLVIWLLLTALDTLKQVPKRKVISSDRGEVALPRDSLLMSGGDPHDSPLSQRGVLNRAEDVDPDFITWINQKRTDMMDRQCWDENVGNGILRGVYIHEETNLAYCPMAKVGCTFWKRIFLFLSKDTGPLHIMHPFQIPRMFVHYGQKNKTRIIKKAVSDQVLGNLTRLLFVRDPYSRLWSAFLDKIYLPDFWPTHAMRIVSLRHRHTSQQNNVSKLNVSVCPNDVTFEEFLEYVAKSDPRGLNEHWQPVKYRCDPCTLKPDFVGKMETFGRDAGYILDQVGMTWVTRDLDRDTLANEELNSLMDYNFSLLRHKFFKRCLTYSGIAHKLFNVFKLNGYIPSSAVAPDWLDSMTRQSARRFRDHILYTHRTVDRQQKVQMTKQRRKALRDAYRHIPLSVLERLTDMFRTDFTAFGYDITPPHLNPNI